MQNSFQYLPLNPAAAQRPPGATRCWYFQEGWLPGDGRIPVLCLQTDEYFIATNYDEYTIYGHLGRLREEHPYFTGHRRGLTYFDDYSERKRGYFAFDQAALWRVDSIMPGMPMMFVLKKVNLKTMEDYKTANTVSVTGTGNVVAAGTGNQIHIGSMNVGGNLDQLKEKLAELKVPQEDIEEVAAIVQQEKPDGNGELPPKAQSWLKKTVDQVTKGASEVVIHTVAHLLAGVIKAYYHLPG